MMLDSIYEADFRHFSKSQAAISSRFLIQWCTPLMAMVPGMLVAKQLHVWKVSGSLRIDMDGQLAGHI